MNLLDKDQIKLIESDVEEARIILLNLSHELVDHICCEVENQMSKDGKSFEEAYALIKKETGISVLQNIQENTLYLTNKNYAIMKTTMKIAGNVSLALLGMGTVFKIFHWPGASVMLVIGFALLCLFFFPSAIYINQKEGGAKGRLVLNLSILFGGIAYMAGILFKVMHWPGAGPLLLAGWAIILLLFLPLFLSVKLKGANTKGEKRVYILGAIALIVFECSTMFKMFHWPGAGILMLTGSIMLVSIFLPMFTYLKVKESGKITGQFVFLIITSMYAVVLTALLSMNVSADILGQFVKEESNSSKITSYFEKKKNGHPIAAHFPSDSLHFNTKNQLAVLSAEADQLQNLILNIKLQLIQEIDQVDKQTALKCISNPLLINRKDNFDLVHVLLIGKDGNGLGKSLKEGLEKFRTMAGAATSSNQRLSSLIENLLNTSVKDISGKLSWEEETFSHNMIISTMAYLSLIEKNVRMIESETVRHIHQANL